MCINTGLVHVIFRTFYAQFNIDLLLNCNSCVRKKLVSELDTIFINVILQYKNATTLLSITVHTLPTLYYVDIAITHCTVNYHYDKLKYTHLEWPKCRHTL